MARQQREVSRPKPAVDQLGVDLAALAWRRSGVGDGSFEVAFVGGDGSAGERGGGSGALWVLLRVAGDPAGRVLIYDRTEWACFLDGVRGGDFDVGEPAGCGGRARAVSRGGSNLCTKDVP